MKPTKVGLPLVVGVALVAVVLWGASPVGTKIAVAEVSPLTVMAIRTIAGGLAGLALAWLLGIPLPATRKDLALVVLAGFCGMIAFPTLFSLGMKLTSATHGSMILACMPVITAAIACVQERRWPRLLWWAGCAVALAGEAALIFSRDAAANSQAMWQGDALVLASTLFACSGYVIGGNLQKRGYPARGTTFWGAGVAACLLLPLTPYLFADADPVAWTAATWASLAYLAFGVTILGYVCWYWALGQGGVGRMGLMQFLQPVSGLLLSMLLLGESIGITVLVASAIILVGTVVATTASAAPRT